MSGDNLQILKRIASGGMAEVSLARQAGPSGVEKLVVVKQILPQHARDPEFLRMFQDEARINALLQHPNLVQMYELGKLEGRPYITMEYLNGEDVRSIYKMLREKGQSLRVDYALNIMVGVCAGLHYAHERTGLDGKPLRIVHRDISPQNVVVTYEGGVKLVDFGIARAENRQNQTQNAVLKGKIPYMAPEQVMGLEIDSRADVYAVGVMLYEMTTGQRPFRNTNDVALMRAIVDEPLTPPQKLIPGYPPELQAIVLKALARNRDERYQTAQDLQAALEEFARRKSLLLSTIPLSRFMVDLFGEKATAYREVLAGLKPVEVLPLDGLGAEYTSQGAEVIEAAEPDTSTESITPDKLGTPSGVAVEATVLPGFEHADMERVGAVTVVRFKGKLNERFSGAELGRVLVGQAIFDLSRVERVTSFGVREWLQMMQLAEPKLAGLYLVNCSEAAVNQLSMIKRFAGPGKVLSFQAPHSCRACGKTFAATVDVAAHSTVLSGLQLPSVSCPTCGKPAEFDDDARSYLAFGPQHPGPLPPAVASALSHLVGARAVPEEAVEKTIEGAATRVRVRATLDGAIRWKRIFDGVEGELTVDLSESERHDDTGARQLALALGGLGEEVSRLSMEGAPRAVVEALGPALEHRLTVTSLAVEGQCPTCAAARHTILKREDVLKALAEGRAPWATCRKCNAQLTFGDLTWVRTLGTPIAPAPAAMAPVEVGSSPAVGRPLPTPGAGPAPWRTWLVAGLLGVVALAIGVALLKTPSSSATVAAPPTPPVNAPQTAPTPTAAQAAAQAAPPAWTSVPVETSGGARRFAGHGGPTSEDPVPLARAAALHELARALGASLGDAAGLAVKKTPQRSDPEALQALVQRLGKVLSAPELFERKEEAWARYAIAEADFAALQKAWAAQAGCGGATLVRAPPEVALPPGATDALVVVDVAPGSAAVRAGLRAGDLVLELAGAPVTDAPSTDQACAASRGKPLPLKVLAGGVTRALRLTP